MINDCTTCKHCESYTSLMLDEKEKPLEFLTCKRQTKQITEVDLDTGDKKIEVKGTKLCKNERSHSFIVCRLFRQCGKEGRFWRQK